MSLYCMGYSTKLKKVEFCRIITILLHTSYLHLVTHKNT